MKKLTPFSIIAFAAFFIISCSDDGLNINSLDRNVTLKFQELNNNITFSDHYSEENSTQDIIAAIQYENNDPKLISEELKEINVVLGKTGEHSYAFVLKNEFENNNQSGDGYVVLSSGMDMDWEIKYDYGFDGRCFVYGRFITGSNGVTIFTPCGPLDGCIGFPEYCPDGPNSAFAKDLDK